MKVMDLDIAGDFIEMVAILMNIKVRMLLPREGSGDEEDQEDPRLELVERLIEYKRFKEAGRELEDMEYEHSFHHVRRYFDFIPGENEVSDEEYLEKVTLFDLIMAFREAIKNMPQVFYHEVKRIEVTVEEQTDYLMDKLNSDKMILFKDLIQSLKGKMFVIVTFIAILELAKKGIITLNQSSAFDDIRIKLKDAA
jgi:segregation and condensation protein A